ncbi:MAG TPA: hypothetical protein VFN22_05690 [Gemmatimonadales bacterium]|nr:hypothetical protein [Gemmatimonadales bacterium]
MRRAFLLAACLMGCTWSNSLYRARQLASSAERAERQDRTEEAATIWGQVAVKAESAYARHAAGRGGGEALWLRGRASARLGDCSAAIPLLEQAGVQAEGAGWQETVWLDLARCRARSDDPTSALAALELLQASRDAAIRREALTLAGRALVRAGRWAEALEALREDETEDGRWQRAIAAAHLGRTSEVLTLVEPRVTRGDTMTDWAALLAPLGGHGAASVDSLLGLLGTMPMVAAATRQQWAYAAANGLAARDPVESERRLQALVSSSDEGPGANSARITLATRRMGAVSDSASLAAALVRVRALQQGGGSAAFVLRPMLRVGDGILMDIRAHPADSALGDLAFFHQARVARDSLLAPALADWLLAEIEHRWPTSPYLVKSMLVRMELQPDSAAAIRARARMHTDSPYLRYLEGREGRPFAVLEDSLDRYLASRAIRPVDDPDTAPRAGLTDFE